MLVHGVLLIAKVTKFSYTRNYCDIIFFEEFDFSVMIYYDMLHSSTFNCKILLPKFNTWKQAHIERKTASRLPFDSTVDRFLPMFSRCYRQMSSASRRKADTITA